VTPTCETRLLDPFLKPRSVAVIGLSRSAIGSPISMLTTLKDFGYGGRIFVVNPTMTAAPGAEVLADLSQLPETVDLAIISVERSSVPRVAEDCASHGIRAAIVITQGFADADEEGAQLQVDLVEISRRTGLRIIGPNTIGVVNALARFTSSFIEVGEGQAAVGQVAQSGFLMMGHHLINNEPAGFCMSVDLGNGCDVSLVDVLDYYEQEEAVRVIECHVEAIEDGRAFMDAASRITRTKPVVVLKAGTSELGQMAVASHTGAVAGAAQVYGAAFRQCGVVQADSAEELRLFSKAFATYGEAHGRRIAVMSFSGGGAVLAMDAIERAGLSLAELSQETASRVQDLFPPWMEFTNPLDIWIPVAKDLHGAFPRILKALLDDDGVDAVLCIYCSYNLPKYDAYDASGHIRELSAAYPDKPVACWSYGLDIEGVTRSVEASRSAMVFPTLDGAARSLARLADWSDWRRGRREGSIAPLNVDKVGSEAIFERVRGQTYVFTEALEILEAYGLPLSPWRLARDEAELEALVQPLVSPVCLKVVSGDILHKSDIGGVVLGLDKGEVGDAYRRLKREVLARMPRAEIAGVVVQEMAVRGHEVIVGMKRDPSFGPCLVFGAGGIYAELLRDTSFRIGPIGEQDAAAMIAETAMSKILRGTRGQRPADLCSIVDVIVRLSQLASDRPEIQEIDLNPVIVTEHGATVVDARFIFAWPEMY
jgi:acetate---CoA ligase (ADP-forming)